MEKSQWKWLFVSIGFSALVMGGVLYFTVDETTIEYISRINPFYLALAILLHILSLGFWALRIQRMSASLGYLVRFRQCLNLVMANMLVAAVTPSQAGGEPVRVHELYRAGVTVGDATAVVIMERIIDGIVLGLGGALAMLFLSRHWGGSSSDLSGLSLVMYAAWVFIITFVLIFVYSVKNPDHLKSVLKRLSHWIDRRWHLRRIEQILATIDREVDNFNQGLVRFMNHGKSGLVWGFIFTALLWLSEFLVASMLLLGLGLPPHFIESLVIQLIMTTIMMIAFTPGGSGIAELGATSLYSLFVPSSIVGIFVLLWRLILYYLNIFLGLLPGLSIVRREFLTRARR
ncbi:MAG: flippase-like domain-containing protein [Methanomicrobiales archaeon]|nr:flippase-like domain-containing protein [Methanomicrobiales archaeon]